ncbi:universal stress protein [Spirosoma pulveris]
MKTILVPTDFSPITEAALSVAVSLARTNGSEIRLLHSVNYPMPLPTPVYAEALTIVTENTLLTYRLLEEDAREMLRQIAENPAYADVTITPILLTNGQPLVDNITTQPADLIVMSSKGADGLDEWLIGSNAEVVVRYAHCPVLVVKHATPNFQPQNIVCAVDVDDRLKSIYHVPFQVGETGLHQFLYVMTPSDNRDPEGIREWVNEFAAVQGITKFELVIHHAKTVPQGVIDYAKEIKADLIVLFTHGHKGLLHLLSGSVAEDVLNHTHIPVLVMRAGQ